MKCFQKLVNTQFALAYTDLICQVYKLVISNWFKIIKIIVAVFLKPYKTELFITINYVTAINCDIEILC